MMPYTVAIVGRPNVGKSSLFNRIIGDRKAITDDKPGVTRDRIYGSAAWLTRHFGLIDTGGIDIGDAPFLEQIKTQAMLAVNEADLIVFVVDSRVGLTEVDTYIARLLYPAEKPVIVAVNKVDNDQLRGTVYEFYSLGFGEPIAVSANHGIGMGDLLDEIIKQMPTEGNLEDDDSIKLAVIGYPNVGKSSLTNRILGQERVIVSDIPGTTRDAIDTKFVRDGKDYTIVDTAGIKKSGQIYESTDKYALLRALKAADRADVLLLVLDGSRELINQDKHVGGIIQEYQKAAVIVVNKWDLVDKETQTMKKIEDDLRDEFNFIPYVEICFVSSLENKRIHTIFEAIDRAYESYNRTLSTSILNEFLMDVTAMNPPKLFNKGMAKFSYMTQIQTKPPTFLVFVNNPNYVHFSYERYLENKIRELFQFTGSPIKLLIRKKV
ncbi:MAG: ribosome biogenesis GTPase Der [Acholeplasmataceae bacterium]|nr:ribosome biogenesis GTPase Der [Acholeplasmataceae bacterium]MDD4203893.1 ribosome biogenesis GTPase Der [Acholeplasmataceae bacterium]MDD4468714.1 ribosome biogenesis GTPase Der [Acholeplasmataceae bacterium]MDD4823848.1 ribosome biogenesis GTPase Der [Acholeplasmataceae bacterium]